MRIAVVALLFLSFGRPWLSLCFARGELIVLTTMPRSTQAPAENISGSLGVCSGHGFLVISDSTSGVLGAHRTDAHQDSQLEGRQHKHMPLGLNSLSGG